MRMRSATEMNGPMESMVDGRHFVKQASKARRAQLKQPASMLSRSIFSRQVLSRCTMDFPSRRGDLLSRGFPVGETQGIRPGPQVSALRRHLGDLMASLIGQDKVSKETSSVRHQTRFRE